MNNENKIEQQIDVLYQNLIDLIGEDELTPLNVSVTIVSLMQVVEKMNGIHGVAKKNLIMRVLEKYKVNHPGNSLDLSMIPSVIDVIVSVDKRDLTISEALSCLQSCLGCLAIALKKNKK